MATLVTPKNSSLPTVTYGNQPDKDGEPQPPLYPHGVFITTDKGTFSIDDPSEVSAVLPRKTYRALLIDPPWAFNVRSKATGQGRSAESHYPTMQPDELQALDVPALMAPDCAVFMWATWPTLPQALALGAAWGLEYKTCAFLWAKTNKRTEGRFVELSDNANWFMGMGYWTRANTEPCLLFTRGKPKRKQAGIRQLVVSAIQRHSQKPDSIYSQIECLVDGPYCELFARQTWANWDCWGNEVESSVEVGYGIG